MSMKKMTFFNKNAKKVAGDKKKATFFTIILPYFSITLGYSAISLGY